MYQTAMKHKWYLRLAGDDTYYVGRFNKDGKYVALRMFEGKLRVWFKQ